MTFTLTEEQKLLKDSAREFVRDRAPVTRLRKVRDDKRNGRDDELWKSMAELGWPGIIIPEALGGAGLGYVGLGVVLEETGRTLASSPLLSTAMIGASALLLGGSDAQKKAHLPAIAEGRLITALAIEESAHHNPHRVAAKAAKAGSGYTLNGCKSFVADGHTASLFIVSARTSGNTGDANGITLFLVKGDAAGLSRHELVTVDSRGAADITFTNVAAEPLGPVDGGAALLDQILDRARIGLAAEMLGQAEAAFEMTSEYIKTRKQFGVAIGKFQVLQHRMVDCFTNAQEARSMTLMASLKIDDKDPTVRAKAASGAKVQIGKSGKFCGQSAVQMHGGMGVTDEMAVSHYFKRLTMIDLMFGNQQHHLTRYSNLAMVA